MKHIVRYLALCLVAPIATAQEPATEMSSQDAPASFKAKVNVVLVPVVVRDRQGRAVGNLTREDFEIFDRRKLQVITAFSIEKPGGRAPKAATPAESEAIGVEPKTLATPERFIMYVFDDVHLRFGDLAQARDAAIRNLETSFTPTDRVAIATTSGQTMLDFTDDAPKLRETLLRLRPTPIATSGIQECPDLSYYMADLIQEKRDPEATRAGIQEAIACMGLNPQDPASIQIATEATREVALRVLNAGDYQIQLVFRVLKDIIRRVSTMPGARRIVLVSPGFFATKSSSDKTDIMDRAIRSNIIINSLDARGLYTDVADVETREYDPFATMMKQQYRRESSLIEADVLSELAEGTGGSFFHNRNDLQDGFRQLAAAPEYTYVLGFSPQNLKLDGRFHSLKVTLKNTKDITLQARRGYYAPTHLEDVEEQAKREIEEALFSREEMNELPITLQTQFFKAGEDAAKIALLVRIDLKQLRFRKADGRNRNTLTIVSGLFDRNGNYVTAMRKTLEMRLRDETLAARQTSGITVRTSLDAKPGAYAIRLVVRDAEGQLMSAQNGAVDIP